MKDDAGITMAISYEYPFRGEITRPEYTTTMNELRTGTIIGTIIGGVDVTLITRRYECEDTTSYVCEVEFENGVM